MPGASAGPPSWPSLTPSTTAIATLPTADRDRRAPFPRLARSGERLLERTHQLKDHPDQNLIASLSRGAAVGPTSCMLRYMSLVL
jgi:hypothetical protein